MSCEKIKDRIWFYLEQEITAEEAAEIEKHLEVCDDCRREMELQQEIMESLHQLPEEELPEGYHGELMEKLRSEAQPKIISFPKKTVQKKKRLLQQWGTIAAAVLVLVVAGGVDGLMKMKGSQTIAIQEEQKTESMQEMDSMELLAEEKTAEQPVAEETAAAEKTAEAAENVKKEKTAVSPQKKETSEAPAAGNDSMGAEQAPVQDTAMPEAAAEVSEAAAGEELEGMPMTARMMLAPPAEAQAILWAAEDAEVLSALQRLIAEAGGQEEPTEAGSVYAVIPVEEYPAFIEAVEMLGKLEWIEESTAEEGAAFQTIQIQLKME